jgi:hypothetical protein
MSKVTRGFRAERWVAAGINHLAMNKGVTDSEWLRRVVTEALAAEGYTLSTYYEALTQKTTH